MYAADVVDADFSESSFSGEQKYITHHTDYPEGGAYILKFIVEFRGSLL